nr:hypothetical protein BCU35_05925 [Vibrio lentus]
MAEKYIIEQPHKTNTMSNSGGCRTRKQQVADAGQASLEKCVWLKSRYKIKSRGGKCYLCMANAAAFREKQQHN